MKKLKITALVVIMLCTSVSAYSNSSLRAMFDKLTKKSSGGDYTHVTAVAGVRGADVYEQMKKQEIKNLYWEK